MIREAIAILLVVSGLGLFGWGLSEPDRALLALPIAVGELVVGLCLYLLWFGRVNENDL